MRESSRHGLVRFNAGVVFLALVSALGIVLVSPVSADAARVHPRVTINAHSPLAQGGTETVTGRITPRSPKSVVILQRHVGKRWVGLGRTRTNRASHYRFKVRLRAVGVNQLRVVAPGNARHRKLISRTVKVTVYGPLRVSQGAITANQNQQGSFKVATSGGYGVKTWTAAGLPAGYSVQNGTIVGATNSYGTYPVTVTVRDALRHVASTSFTMTVKPVWTWTATPYATQTGVPQDLSCVGTSFCLMADAQGALVPYRSNGTLASGHWGTPINIGDPNGDDGIGVYSHVSCASATLCVAMRGYASSVAVFNGTTATPSLVQSRVQLYSVSCPLGTTTCFALANNGTVFQYANGTWTQTNFPLILGNSAFFSTFVCASATTCFATDTQGNIYTLSGGNWAPVNRGTYAYNQLACSSPTSCMATEQGQYYSQWNGTSWSASASFPNYVGNTSGLSCSQDGHCAAAVRGGTLTWNGSTWTTGPTFDSSKNLDAIQCPATTADCLAVDALGYSFVSPNGTWTSLGLTDPNVVLPHGTTAQDNGGGSFSCPTTTFCMMPVGNNVSVWNGSSWSAPQPVDTSTPGTDGQGITSIACPSTTLCMATMNQSVYTWNGTSWSTGQALGASSSASSLVKVVCPSATLCFADFGGTMFKWNGSAWDSGTPVSGSDIVDYSCPTTSMCLAIDSSTDFEVFNGATWSKPAAITGFNPSYYLFTVGCASPTYCLAGGIGNFASFNGTSWSALKIPGQAFIDVSKILCVTGTTDCLVQSGQSPPSSASFMWSHDGGQWDNGGSVNGIAITGGTCTSATSCVLAGYKNGTIYTLQGAA